jgi:hypothetical protein
MENHDKPYLVTRLVDIHHLERQSRRLLYIGFLFSVIFYGLVGILITFKAPYQRIRPVAEKPEKPIPLEIIVVPPRDTEPFKIRERRFEKKIIQREGSGYRMPSKGIETKEPSSLFGKQEKPLTKEAPGSVQGKDNLMNRFLDSLPNDIGVQRGPSDRIPQRRDASRDPGMFRSDIIYNPDNKEATQGYVHIPLIRIDDLGQPESMVLSLRGLVAVMNRHTNITAILDNPLSPIQFEQSSRNFLHIKEITNLHGISVNSLFEFRPPLVYFLVDREFRFSEEEKGSIRMYLGGGGMLFMENAKPGDAAFRDIARGIWLSIFEDTLSIPPIEPIPKDHPIYHCFYDFENGPPEGAGQELGAVPYKVQPCLEGMFNRGRLLAVFSDRGYGLCWGKAGKYEEQERMGVNMVVYSLLQRQGQAGKMVNAER